MVVGRASLASRALALGASLSMIGKLLGHNKIGATARCAHLARDAFMASSAQVADSIGADILDEAAGEPESRPAQGGGYQAAHRQGSSYRRAARL